MTDHTNRPKRPNYPDEPPRQVSQQISHAIRQYAAAEWDESQRAVATLTTMENRFMKHACYMEVSAGVRYWEDAVLNGQEDFEGLMPLRNGELWELVIELATGRILDWPHGNEASVHYKVCDAGRYWLLDASKTRIAQWSGSYVPDVDLCPQSKLTGDYIIFMIRADGFIEGWVPPTLSDARWRALATG